MTHTKRQFQIDLWSCGMFLKSFKVFVQLGFLENKCNAIATIIICFSLRLIEGDILKEINKKQMIF